MATFQQKCQVCRKKWVTVSNRQRFVICYDCQKKQLEGEIKDPAMKRMFKIPEDFYMKSAFLRSIKANYLRYGQLTEKQIEAFKKTVKSMKEKAKEGN
jgi:hypothetical protein